MFNVNRGIINSYIIDGRDVIGDEEALPQAPSSDPNHNPNPISTSSPSITSILKCNSKGIAIFNYYTGSYELTDIAELIKEETDGNVIIEPDKNTMKCLMEIKQVAISFDIENSIASLLGFRKKVYKKGK